MAGIKMGEYVRVIATGRIGVATDKVKTLVTVVFYDRSSLMPETEEFKYFELEATELPKMKTSQLMAFVRGEISLAELTNGVCILPGEVLPDSGEYQITARDFLAGVNHYDGMPTEDVFRWLDTLMFFSEDMEFPNLDWEPIRDAVKEQNLMDIVYQKTEELYWWIIETTPVNLQPDSFKEIRSLLENWIESDGKDYPDSIRFRIAGQYDSDSIDSESEATRQLFKECLDYCCDVKRDPKSIQKRGYCYYCGTKVYPNDWFKARDAFIDYYQLTGDASAANTLGYIYYYGRCNGGVPQYEEAFRYFSIGHAYTYFESTYKLADMLAHGYGVVKNGETANHLYWSVYEQCLERFIRGDFECSFADAALRMGNCFKDKIGAPRDLETAYSYYLQADLAIRERTKISNHYGDTVVFNGIQKALCEVRTEYTERRRSKKFTKPDWVWWTLIDHRRCKLTIKELGSGALAIRATPLKRREEKKAPMMLITIPEADYCALTNKISVRTAAESRFKTFDGKPEIIFDGIEYDWKNQKTSFYLYDKCVGEITTEYYSFTAPGKKKEEPTGNVYHFASVVFQENGRSYDYLCEDTSVKAGDLVIVQGYDGETTVKVVAVADRYESELGLPIERYKSVVRKAAEAEK